MKPVILRDSYTKTLFALLMCLAIEMILLGCSYPHLQPSPPDTKPFSYMDYMKTNHFVYQTNYMTNVTVWRAK